MDLADSQHIPYRPEIDGLRGIAVLSVVLFHAGLSFTGGFVGVDVFFVISGYLLTSIIVNDIRHDRFTFFKFWERRARRILPPVAVMNVLVLIAGWFLLLPTDFLAVGQSVIAQTLFAANIYFWRSTGYFAGTAEEMPLLHTWSLAVEEQFYFLLPILLLITSKLRKSRWINPVSIGLLSVWVISFSVSLHGVIHRPSTTFFLLPARAWELVCGSLVAVVPATRLNAFQFIQEVAAFCGAAAILIPCLVYDRQTLFPGAAALPPCLGTAMIIWSSSHAQKSATTSLIARALSFPALVGVGLISYSMYLWHWPLFAFEKMLNIDVERSTVPAIGLTVASLVLGWISWRFIETPFRRKHVCASRPAFFSFAVCSGLCLIVAGACVQFRKGFTERFSPKAVAYAAAGRTASSTLPLSITSLEDVLHDRLGPIGDITPGSPPTVLIWGDSHAQFAAPAFDALLKDRHIVGRIAMHGGTPPVLDYYCIFRGVGLCEESPRYNAAILDNAVKHRFRHVVLIARWDAYYSHLSGLDSTRKQTAGRNPAHDTFERGLFSLVQRLREAKITPWLMLPVPSHTVCVPRALARYEMHGRDLSLVGRSATAEPSPYTVPFDLEKLRAIGCRILDPIPEFLNTTTGRFEVVRSDVVLYWDDNHLTDAGARKVLLPFLRREFNSE